VTTSVTSGDAILGAARRGADRASRQFERFGTQGLAIALDGEAGPVKATLGASWLGEDRTVLGGYWHQSFGASGADTLFLDGTMALDVGSDWRLGAAYRHGLTRPNDGGLIAAGSRISSNAFSFDVAKRNAFTRGDSIGFRIAQPLRVTGGGLDLILPTGYDYASESAIFGTNQLSLAPEGREVMGELTWRGSIAGGAFSSSVFLRSQPGHYAQAPDDAGMVLRWNRQF